MINLLVVRHGNTFEKNQTPTRVGLHTDLPLVESGITQAKKMGEYLFSKKIIPEYAFASELKRTYDSCSLILQSMGLSLPIATKSIFNEIDYGPDENQPEDAVVNRIGQKAINLWNTQGVPPSGWKVDVAAIKDSWCDFAAGLITDGNSKTVLVVTSNGIARFAPAITGDFERFQQQYPLKIRTGSLCHFNYDAQDCVWKISSWDLQPLSP